MIVLLRSAFRHRRRLALAGGVVGRFLLRKRIARERRKALTVVAGATVGGLVALTLAAEWERTRQG